MPRSLINVLGVVITIAVLALGILLIAMPIGLQALGVVGQTVTVTSTNALYQTQIDALHEQEQHLVDTQASVADLQTQITTANEFDDVFELVAKAADASGVTITSVSVGETAAFVERTSPVAIDAAAAPAVATAPDATSDGSSDSTTVPGAATSTTQVSEPAVSGRTQADFTISVTGGDMGQVIGFLDALRAGPRLLGQVQSTVVPANGAFDVTVSALTFVLPQEG
ncbi:hypothetical protein ABZ477_18695 [Microbacterium sp. NPDC019599]|uniref:hypothetical protein n=1 Tax=Microbacterium sp. NPDC019599 TaxID=3154690 RepID=UPI00340919DC